jgi:2',3'-cyclic-nucleotide 3'-phosphodiesterase
VVSDKAQAWLDALPLALADQPNVLFRSLDVGTPFFKKLTLSVAKGPLQDIASQIRAAAIEDGDATAARHWAIDVYAPHVSLLYADIEISEQKRTEILQDLESAGIGLEADGALRVDEAWKAWKGGRIVLVSTWKDLEEWSVTAERLL